MAGSGSPEDSRTADWPRQPPPLTGVGMSHNAQVVLTGRKRWLALVFLSLGVAMIILDATVVNVAIPTMIKDLGLTTTDAEWVTAAYSLTFASLLILAGRVADRAEIAPLDVGVDVDHRQDRVVRHQPRRAGLRDARQRPDDLSAAD